MTIGAGNRNAKGLPVDADGKRDWSFPLFGCLGDMSKCASANVIVPSCLRLKLLPCSRHQAVGRAGARASSTLRPVDASTISTRTERQIPTRMR